MVVFDTQVEDVVCLVDWFLYTLLSAAFDKSWRSTLHYSQPGQGGGAPFYLMYLKRGSIIGLIMTL